MSERRRSPKRNNRAQYFGSGPFVQIFDDLRKSPAYSELPPMARLILCDMIRAYGRASSRSNGYTPEGFEYTLGACLERCTSNTFYAAIRMIVNHGFFETPPALQPESALTPRRFRPSSNWKGFVENAKSKRAETGRARALARSQERKRACLTTGRKQNEVAKNGTAL